MSLFIKHSSTQIAKEKSLVLFHGWGFDSHVWNAVLPILTEDFNVYAVDLPGFGKSEWMDWSDFKTSLNKLLPESSIFLGWSMGGLLALRYAIECPNRVSHFIGVASSPRFIGDSDWPGIDTTVFDQFYNRLRTNPDAVLGEFIRLQLRPSLHTPLPRAGERVRVKGLKEGLDILKNWDLRNGLANLKMPGMYIFGQLDSIVPKATVPAMMKNFPQIKTRLISKAAHMLFLSHSNLWYEKINEFVR